MAMSRGPYGFKLCDARSLIQAAKDAGLPADRLRLRYDPKTGISVEARDDGKGEASIVTPLEQWRAKRGQG
jgi:hypothetical protein